MEYKLIIKGRFPGLNDFISANRTSPHVGNRMKQDNQDICIWSIRQQLRNLHILAPVFIKYYWYEQSKKRDLDNISSFGRKVIQDALVKTNVLEDDGWKQIKGFSDNFYLDKKEPRIEIIITEVGD